MIVVSVVYRRGGYTDAGEVAGGRGAPDGGHRTPDGRSAEGDSVDETSGLLIAWVLSE